MHMKSRTAGWRFHTSIRPGQRSTSTMRGDAQPGSGQATRLSNCPASTRQEPPFDRGTRFLDNRFLEVGTKSAVLGGCGARRSRDFEVQTARRAAYPPLRRNYLKVAPLKRHFCPKVARPAVGGTLHTEIATALAGEDGSATLGNGFVSNERSHPPCRYP